MVNGIVICILALESITDIRSKNICIWHMALFGIVGIAMNFILPYQSISSIIGGIIIGVIVLIFALFSKGSIGLGDGIVFICLGIYLGLSDNLKLLFYSLIIAAVVGGIYVFVRKKSIKAQIPFVPCILIAYILMTVMEVLL